MKKLYWILLSVLAACLLCVGIYSVVTFPTERLPAVALGNASAALEDAYAANFPFREALLTANRAMNGFYYFGGGEDNLLAIDYQGGAEFGGERLGPPPAADSETEAPPVETKPAPVLPHIDLPSETDVTAVGTIIIHGNRAMDIPTADEDVIVSYGRTAGRIAEALDGVRTFCLVTPNSGQFYSPVSFHTGQHDQKAMIDLCYAAMSREVIPVDAYSSLAAHADEYLFFRTDHHWTQKGAYYAYTAFCQAAGFTPPALSDFESGSYEGFIGSMYNYTSGYPQSEALRDQPDVLTYYLPLAETSARYYLDAEMTEAYHVPVVDAALQESVTNKYLCYLSGDTPVCVIDTDAEGGTCLVLKESYGNAFLPFLTSHYSRIIAVDPREFNDPGKPELDLKAFAVAQGVDDLLILNYPFMINSKTYTAKLAGLVE